MNFGQQVITHVSLGQDATHLDRYGKPTLTRTQTVITGCLFRAMNPSYRDEKVDTLGDITINQWKCTAPPVAALVNCKANDQVIFNGVTYEVQVGPRVYYTRQGIPYKVTLICQLRGG